MKLFNAFPHAQQLKAPLQLSCKRHSRHVDEGVRVPSSQRLASLSHFVGNKKGGTPIGVPTHFIESKNIKRSVADQGRALLRGEKA